MLKHTVGVLYHSGIGRLEVDDVGLALPEELEAPIVFSDRFELLHTLSFDNPGA